MWKLCALKVSTTSPESKIFIPLLFKLEVSWVNNTEPPKSGCLQIESLKNVQHYTMLKNNTNLFLLCHLKKHFYLF
jgi:hypothetical protein